MRVMGTRITVAKKEYLDPDTGRRKLFRIIEYAPTDRRKFAKFYDAILLEAACDKDIAGKAIRLLLYAVSRLPYGLSQVYIHPDEACRDLGIGRRTFFLWRRSLVKKGLLVDTGLPYIYEIPIEYIRRG